MHDIILPPSRHVTFRAKNNSHKESGAWLIFLHIKKLINALQPQAISICILLHDSNKRITINLTEFQNFFTNQCNQSGIKEQARQIISGKYADCKVLFPLRTLEIDSSVPIFFTLSFFWCIAITDSAARQSKGRWSCYSILFIILHTLTMQCFECFSNARSDRP